MLHWRRPRPSPRGPYTALHWANPGHGGAITPQVRDIVAAVTGTELEEIDTETPLMEVGLTSSSAIVMQETLSKELGMKLPMTLVFDYPTISDMAEMVQEQTSQKAIQG